MNRFACLSSLVLLCVGGARAQDFWTKQSPIPTDRSLSGVHAFSGDRVFVSGLNRHLLETKNRGRSWITHRSADYGADPFYAVRFRNAEVGMVVGNNNDALRTTNSGASWSPVGSVLQGSWYHIDFVSDSVAMIGANGACMASTDGGATFALRSAYPTCPVMYGMDFRDADVGLVGGWQSSTQEYGIFKTTDGGRNWVRKHSDAANAVLWMSPLRAIADSGTTILQTMDAGETWFPIAVGIGSGILNFARAGSGEVVCGVSGKGDIWRSEDGGFTWVQTLDGPGALPAEWNMHFADATHGWVVGDIGFIFETSDGGITWHQVNHGCGAQITDIQLLDADFGMAVGHNGYIFRTTNGGAFWDVKKLEVTGQIWGRDEDLVAIDVVDRSFAAAAGPGGTVFKTMDGGESWVSIGYPALSGNLWLYDVDFVDHDLGYIYGVDFDGTHTHSLYRTTNGGASWQWIDLGQRGGGTTVQFIDTQTGWISADNDFGQRTLDGGVTWIDFHLPGYFTGPEVSKVRFLDRLRGWAVGWFGYAAKTSDGGATWTLVDMGTIGDNLFDVVPVSASEIWMCGRVDSSSAGVVYHSTNAGQTWSRQVVQPWPTYPYRISALDSGHVAFAGYGGTIFRRSTRVTGTLTLGDYPISPAGREVRFDLLQGGQVVETRWAVLDSLGRYSFESVRRGPTTIRAKASHWLARTVATVSLANGTVAAPSVALVNGDIDGDNEVSVGDYALLSVAFGSSPSEPAWNAEADLNGDGAVDIGDFAILSLRFGAIGD